MEPALTGCALPACEPPAHLYAGPRTLLLGLALAEYTALETYELDNAAYPSRAPAAIHTRPHLPVADA